MGIVRLVKPVKANIPRKMKEENLIQVFSVMQNKHPTLSDLLA